MKLYKNTITIHLVYYPTTKKKYLFLLFDFELLFAICLKLNFYLGFDPHPTK